MVSAGEENVAAGAHEAAGAQAEGSGQRGAAVEGDVIVLARESPVEAAAVKQLHWVARLPGVFLAVGLPDLHPGTLIWQTELRFLVDRKVRSSI